MIDLGLAEGLFDGEWYLARYPDAAESGLSPLEHYLSRGAALDRDPGPLFSSHWYLSTNPDVKEAGVNPLEHYLSWGTRELRDPSPIFDSVWYFARYPHAAAPGVDARLHYMTEGARAGYDPNPFFSTAWYLETYREVAESGANALLHYMTIGARLGYDPSPQFCTAASIASPEETSASGENPLAQYLARRRNSTDSAQDPALGSACAVSRVALQETKELIGTFADIEPDLALVLSELESLASAPIEPDRAMAAWRGLYLSLFEAPRGVILVSCIDTATGLEAVTRESTGILVLEADSAACSTAERLPPGVQWRSLAEFDGGLDSEERIKIVAALINHLQPAALLVWGSPVGWETLARFGTPLGRATAVFATTHAVPELSTRDLLRRYFRICVPLLSAIYGPNRAELKRAGALFGLPPSEHSKLQSLDAMDDDGGFLAVVAP